MNGLAELPWTRRYPGADNDNFYRIEIKPLTGYLFIRSFGFGDRREIFKICGQRENGEWETLAWLLHENQARLLDGELVLDTVIARQLLGDPGARLTQVSRWHFTLESVPFPMAEATALTSS